ncbi:MAG: tetratricopeptide repeat protein, partial [Bacteroidetes bacterium]|nr:tetratricopeptide repeat protein [Bacteroidota bacterium]
LADFNKAKEYYQKSDYENAARLYESIVKSGMVSAEVYYNLGNCYFKTGNISATMLQYERAKKFSPDDEDISFNIKIASLKVVDKMEVVPEVFYKRWQRNIALFFTTDTWTKIFLVNFWLLFIFLSGYVISASSFIKKISFITAIIFLITSVSTFMATQKSYSMTYVDQQAIITSASVYVKNSPDEKGSDQFIIHEGTKVDVLDELGDWKKIRIANGSIGWLKQNEMEVI